MPRAACNAIYLIQSTLSLWYLNSGCSPDEHCTANKQLKL
jgi:hypothetical protein